jgi:hypothetical protein
MNEQGISESAQTLATVIIYFGASIKNLTILINKDSEIPYFMKQSNLCNWQAFPYPQQSKHHHNAFRKWVVSLIIS